MPESGVSHKRVGRKFPTGPKEMGPVFPRGFGPLLDGLSDRRLYRLGYGNLVGCNGRQDDRGFPPTGGHAVLDATRDVGLSLRAVALDFRRLAPEANLRFRLGRDRIGLPATFTDHSES